MPHRGGASHCDGVVQRSRPFWHACRTRSAVGPACPSKSDLGRLQRELVTRPMRALEIGGWEACWAAGSMKIEEQVFTALEKKSEAWALITTLGVSFILAGILVSN